MVVVVDVLVLFPVVPSKIYGCQLLFVVGGVSLWRFVAVGGKCFFLNMLWLCVSKRRFSMSEGEYTKVRLEG